ncbi:ABC transporter permease subunit [Xylophilus rhododendri]|uniref:ABC transporter permease subunit n=1 Tax=Xylophilus rhododendri TaxID=2697032 RepID=A0A857J6F6_9BURK|nr:ABC transporter permease subunit [Xylophilus rhododendri]QHI98378.1 ABC transporter permease subunit [Xylophilus rhododendri]
MSPIVDNFFNPAFMLKYGPSIAFGLWETVQMAVLVVATGLAGGLLLAALRTFAFKPANFLIVVFADICRALPPLVLIIVCYFGLPLLGLRLPGFFVAWAVLSAILMAFAEEVFWAGLNSIHKGQWDAARSTGLGLARTLRLVILPQAVRVVVPPLTSRVVATVKNTALASTVAVPDMLSRASEALAEGANTTPLTMAAIGYLLLLLPLVLLSRRLERRYAWTAR